MKAWKLYGSSFKPFCEIRANVISVVGVVVVKRVAVVRHVVRVIDISEVVRIRRRRQQTYFQKLSPYFKEVFPLE